jgi:hypothetical protein
MIPQSNIDFANKLFDQRIGQPYCYGGSWSSNIYDQTDCSGCVSMMLAALTRGSAMQWGHPISTETWPFAYPDTPAEPGTIGPYGTVAVASIDDVPPDAVAIVNVGHHGGGAQSHVQLLTRIQPGFWRTMEDNGSYGVCDQTCGAMDPRSSYWTDTWYLPKETSVDTIFPDVSEFQCPADDSLTDAGYRVLSFRSNDGSHLDSAFDANYAWATAACDAGKLDFFIVYYYWRPGETGVANHMAMVNNAGGPHPRQVSMIDLETGGNPTWDQSDVLNDEYNQLVKWLGNPKRVIGYANVSDERTLWQARPDDLPWILAGYGANPYDPSLIKLAHQYTDGTGYGAANGLPDGAPPFGNCDMNSADGLSPIEFANLCGIEIGDNVSNKPADEATEVSQVWDQLRMNWPQLGGRSLVDAVAAIGAALNISGFIPPAK